jgi:hypothetical protein
VSGSDVVDAFGNPLIMISQVIPKVQFHNVQLGWGSIAGLDTTWFGLGTSGFTAGTGPWASIMTAKRWRLLGLGRVRLSKVDAGDGSATPVDSTYLPDAGNLLASDRRFYATAGFENDFEVWSAGPSGAMAWMRHAPGNTAAIPFAAIYDRGLR